MFQFPLEEAQSYTESFYLRDRRLSASLFLKAVSCSDPEAVQLHDFSDGELKEISVFSLSLCSQSVQKVGIGSSVAAAFMVLWLRVFTEFHFRKKQRASASLAGVYLPENTQNHTIPHSNLIQNPFLRVTSPSNLSAFFKPHSSRFTNVSKTLNFFFLILLMCFQSSSFACSHTHKTP